MAKETFGINTRTMPKTSASTTAKKVCQWSDFIIFCIIVPKNGGRGRESAKFHILSNLVNWGKI